MSLTIGSVLGPYEILAAIGAGGMGEVYRARDRRLDRDVAVKILPAALSGEPDMLARFEREAKALAALSHPHILSIHDFGQDRGIWFVVTELLEGETLRSRLERGTVPLRRSVEWALQIAQGLVAAHARGVIHRDLKPENVFLSADSHVKILDFGLARTVRPVDGDATMTGVGAAPASTPGALVGTVGYMSPEQVQGRTADERSDIFSFGCVLYELVAGRRPFRGRSAIDTLHDVLHTDPPAIDEVAPETPHELRWMLRKCLAKDPDERYQSSKDLVVDLQSLRRQLESSSSAVPATPTVPPPTRRSGPVLAAIGVLAIAGAGALVFWWSRSAATPETVPSKPISIHRLTTTGTVIDAAVSPDGRYIVYSSSEAGQQGVRLRQVDGARTVEILAPAPRGMWGVRFSPDGNSIYYALKDSATPPGVLYQVSTLGGSPKKLLTGVDSVVTFSPDGRRIAFVRVDSPRPGESAVIVANADGTGERVLASRARPELFAPIFFTAVSWSPDGTQIVCPVATVPRGTGSGIGHGRLVALNAETGAEQPFRNDQWFSIGQVEWLPDGRGLLLVASDRPRQASQQLWLLPYPSGTPRAITSDLFAYRKISLTADGKTVVSVAADVTSSIWQVPLDGSRDAQRVTSAKYEGLSGVAAMPSGEILFRSIENESTQIWLMDHEGGKRRQLTSEGVNSWPYPSPDGRHVVFSSVRGKGTTIWRVDATGENARQLEQNGPSSYPTLSPDGQWVVYTSAASGIESLWKVPLAGGMPVKIPTTSATTRPAVSPDGRFIAALSVADADAQFGIVVIPFEGGAPVARFPTAFTGYSRVRWTPDSRSLLYTTALAGDRSNIWRQPVAGGPPTKVTQFQDQDIFDFDRSPDGKSLVIARGVLSRDAVMIGDFR